ncbi:extensin-like [Thrips palmi]|uniref:Extensin-like n=1 Tax=Thrips palmi TaxID=161013 RepID=A0A6P8ZIV1_THRPL|nr:extensin-like [Thrips palmi]
MAPVYYSPSRRPVARPMARDASPARRAVMSPTRIPVRTRDPSPEPARFIQMPAARSRTPSPSRGVQTDPKITKTPSPDQPIPADEPADAVLKSPTRSSQIPVPISRVSSPVRKDETIVEMARSSPKRAPPSRTPTKSPRRVAKAHEKGRAKEDATSPRTPIFVTSFYQRLPCVKFRYGLLPPQQRHAH